MHGNDKTCIKARVKVSDLTPSAPQKSDRACFSCVVPGA